MHSRVGGGEGQPLRRLLAEVLVSFSANAARRDFFRCSPALILGRACRSEPSQYAFDKSLDCRRAAGCLSAELPPGDSLYQLAFIAFFLHYWR